MAGKISRDVTEKLRELKKKEKHTNSDRQIKNENFTIY